MTPIVSRRAERVIASPIRKFLPLVRKAETEGVTFYKLNVGDPDLPAPASVLKGTRRWTERHIGYAPSPGIAEHVAAWQHYYQSFGVSIAPDQLIPTQGAAEAMLMALQVVADPGDEVLVFEPLYPTYKGYAALLNIKLKPVTLTTKKGFVLPSVARIRRAITPRTKAILVINPDNPTGKVWNEQELKQIIALAQKHNLFIISDETYRGITFGRGGVKSMLQHSEARERSIVLDSLSKRLSAPGLRVGAIVSFRDDVMAALLKIAMLRLSVQTVGQMSTIEALKEHPAIVPSLAREYQHRAETVDQALKAFPMIETNKPTGAFYQVVRLPLPDAEPFIRFLITEFRHRDRSVLVTPMEDFYVTPGLGKHEVRIAYVLKSRDLTRAIDIFGRGLEAFLKK